MFYPKNVFIWAALSLSSLLLLLSKEARANLAENAGFGSQTAALAGAGNAWGAGPYATYSNPAMISSGTSSAGSAKPLNISWGLIYLQPSFTPIRNVTVENTYVSDQSRRGDVDTSYRNTFGQAFAFTYRLSETRVARPTLGLVAFLPIDQLAYADTGEVFIPEYFLHRARTQRPQFAASFAFQLESLFPSISGVSFGAGVAVSYALTGNGTVFLNTDPAKASTMRINASLKPRGLPYAGLYFGRDRRATGGIIVRAPLSSTNEYTVNSGARAFGNLAALDFNFKASSALYYDPLTVECGGSYEITTGTRLIGQIELQRWSAFVPPALKIENPQTGNCSGAGCSGGVTISGSKNPSFDFDDILIPRIGLERAFGDRITARAGYFYRPGIISVDQLSGAGNYLDPARHAFSAGLGWRFNRFLHLDTPFGVDLHAQLHRLEDQTITKTPGNENGVGGEEKIGGPGYEAGGSIFGGGLTLSWNL